MRVDVVVMAALDSEIEAARDVLVRQGDDASGVHQGKEVSNYRIGIYDYTIVTFGNGARVAIAPATGMGQLNAAIGTNKMLEHLVPDLIVLVGIAGCMRDRTEAREAAKCYLGDVFVADQIVDCDLNKLKNGKLIQRGRVNQCERRVVAKIGANKVKGSPWHSRLGERPDKSNDPPSVFVGTVLSGSTLLADEAAKVKLREDDRQSAGDAPNRPATIAYESLAYEMESSGVAAAAMNHEPPVPLVVIKSFSDWADGKKDDTWQPYCMNAAAHFLSCVLENVVFEYIYSFRGVDGVGDPALRQKHLVDRECRRFQGRIESALDCFLESPDATAPFVKPMAEKILKQAALEVTKIVGVANGTDDSYETDINLSSQFLLRARALFSSASKVYVTSLDTVSQFWIDEDNRMAAKGYLQDHPSNTVRLFVFSSPDNAHRHAHRLNAHVRHTPDTFLCSKKDYEFLIKEVIEGSSENYTDYTSKDFSILHFESPDSARRVFFASLDSKDMELESARQQPRDRDINCSKLVEKFDELSRLNPGEVHEGTNILKWTYNHHDSIHWPGQLSRMFAERESDTFHMISLDVDEATYRQIRGSVARIKYNILDNVHPGRDSIARRFGVKNVWFIKQIDRQCTPVVDGTTGSTLQYGQSGGMKYVLLIRIDNETNLNRFLANEDNLGLRLELFRLLDESVREFMEVKAIDTLAGLKSFVNTPDGERLGLLYSIIESVSSIKFKRHDFVDDEIISEMVKSNPPTF